MTTTAHPPTRHWLEAWIDTDTISSRVTCEHPDDCTATPAISRHQGCAIRDHHDNIGDELLTFPYGVKPLIGRVEIGVEWMGPAEDAYVALVPVALPSLTDPSEHTFRAAERLTTPELAAVVLATAQQNTDLDMCGARHAIMARNISEDVLDYLLTQGWTPPGEVPDAWKQDNGPPAAQAAWTAADRVGYYAKGIVPGV